ncbi:MAG: hypothetical protein ACLUVC_09420 [Longibaculum sp.]
MKNKWIKIGVCLSLAIILVVVGLMVHGKNGYDLETPQGQREAIADLKGVPPEQVDIIATHVNATRNQLVYMIVVKEETGYDFYLFEKSFNHMYRNYFYYRSDSFQIALKIRDKKHGLYFVFATNMSHQISEVSLAVSEGKPNNYFVEKNQDYLTLSFDNKDNHIADAFMFDEYGMSIENESSYEVSVD